MKIVLLSVLLAFSMGCVTVTAPDGTVTRELATDSITDLMEAAADIIGMFVPGGEDEEDDE